MARIFIVDDREHPDPDANLTIEQVRDMLADFYPELANATHTVTARGEDQVVDFRRTVGTKGASHHHRCPCCGLRWRCCEGCCGQRCLRCQ